MRAKMVAPLHGKRKRSRKPLVSKAEPARKNVKDPQPYKKLIGQRLRTARKHADMTQQFVGGALKVTHSTVGQWELGRTQPDVTHLIDAAKLYKVSLDWCCGISDQEHPASAATVRGDRQQAMA